MDSATLYVLAAAVLFGLGLDGLIVCEHLMRKLFALNIMGSAIFILLVATSAPINDKPDPVPQALVLTGIVVAVSATAFGLALIVRLCRESGKATLSVDDEPENDD
ncbi:MAG: cation:proton antiporter subunit C [Wenzhouxiangella sp.]|jgi:multicomponent Na+:H+ antiporter subunit C|nr:cation:proton antiporter subunit C [Wenzhouxiangella sp.]